MNGYAPPPLKKKGFQRDDFSIYACASACAFDITTTFFLLLSRLLHSL